MDLKTWVREARRHANLTQEQLAEKLHMTKGNISGWENGRHAPSFEQTMALAKLTGLPAPGAQFSAKVDERPPEVPFLPGFEALSIPVLAQSGSMGHGEDQLHDEVVVGRLTVSPQWVSRTIKPLTKLENLRFIHGYGDSMDPTFADGDILLVDAGIQEPKIDGVYVLEANDRIYIKRVRQRMDGSFEVSSDNPNVRTVDVLDGTQPVNVRGRVVWVWNGRKL